MELSRGENTKAKDVMVIDLYREFEEKVLLELKAESDETKRYLKFIAWLNSKLEGKGVGRIIITGGFAVEVYTARTHRTMDVDIIVEGKEAVRIIEEFLKQISERIGRGYLPYHEALTTKSIDIVSTKYTKTMEPVKLQVNQGHVYLEPPEELIITYLASWKYWKSTEDRDKAIWLYITWNNKLNKEYLKKRAIQEKVEDKLKEIEETIKHHKHSN